MHFQLVLLVALASIGCALSAAVPLDSSPDHSVQGEGAQAQVGLSQLEPVEGEGSNLESNAAHRRDARFIFPVVGYPVYHHHYYRSYPVWGYHGYHHYW